MIAISKEVFIDANNPIISHPNIPEGNYEVIIVLQSRSKKKPRRAGFSKACFQMSADFNAPLDDFKELSSDSAFDAYSIVRIW